MSLRLRLFLLLAGAVVLMFALAWWSIRWLTDQVTADVSDVAVRVGQQVFEVIEADAPAADAIDELVVERRLVDGDREVVTRQTRKGGQVVGLTLFVDGEKVEDFEWHAGAAHRIDMDSPLHLSLDQDRDVLVFGGTVDRQIDVPRGGVEQTLRRYANQLYLFAGALLVLALVAAAWAANRLSRPLVQLAEAAREVGEGELGRQVTGTAQVPEVQATIRDFNRMSSQLKDLHDAAEKLRARQHLHELGEVGRGLAHSLRNPLNVIGLSIDRLRGKANPNDAEATALVASAQEQIRRIDRSLRSFLVLAGNAAESTGPVSLSAVINDVILEVAQTRAQARIDLDVADEVSIVGIRAEIQAAVQAVIVNAVEASDAPVAVRIWREGDDALVEVADRGPGLPEEIREHLFQPHRTTKDNGSGMGLFIAHRVAQQRYGGDIEVTDRNGGGTVVTLRFGQRLS